MAIPVAVLLGQFKPKTGKGSAKRNVPTDLSIKD